MNRISLVVIARDEERCLARCLDSARRFVDQMVVLDTGSIDRTAQIARDCGAQVHHWTWTDSFAEARNAALALSASHWNLILDADEWIDPAADPLMLHAVLETKPFVGELCVRSAFDSDGSVSWSETWIPRLLPSAIRYRGRIHEQPVHDLASLKLPLMIHHDGYRTQIAHRKSERNLSLLQRSLLDQPNSAYLHHQIGVAHEGRETWNDAADHYLQALALGATKQPYGHALGVRLLHVLTRCGRFGDALAWAREAEACWPQSSDVFFAIGNLCLDLAQAEQERAEDSWLPSAQAAWERCLEIGETSPYGNHVLGRGSYLAAHNLSVLHAGTGRAEQARRYAGLAQEMKSSLHTCASSSRNLARPVPSH